MQLYKAFHLMQKLRRKLRGVRGRGLKVLRKCAPKLFFYFRHLLCRFKNRNICLVLPWICITGKQLLELEFIKANLSLFKLSSAYLGLLT